MTLDTTPEGAGPEPVTSERPTDDVEVVAETPAAAIASEEAEMVEPPPLAPAPDSGEATVSWWATRPGRIVRFVLAALGALVVFGIFMGLKGAEPLAAYRDMFKSTFGDTKSIGQILVRAAPIILAALAVAVPARAGMVNVGGEGQLLIGGIAAAGVSLWVGDALPYGVTMILMAVGAGLAGAAWAGLTAVLRLVSNINEAVTTLLLNYVALAFMGYLIFSPWKDANGSGQPATPLLPVGERLPLIGWDRVHAGIIVALVATAIIWAVLRYTSWGFRLRTVGGNPEAARRAGLRVGTLLISAMAVGGLLAGLGGWVQLAGAEFKLRQGFIATYGYVGFLASWLARHKPIWVAVSATALSAIAVGGVSLQLDSKLPAASVNVLMAVVLLAVFGFSRPRVKEA